MECHHIFAERMQLTKDSSCIYCELTKGEIDEMKGKEQR